MKIGKIHEYKSKDRQFVVDTWNLSVVGGAVGYITGYLPAEQISGIGALALIFIGVGAGTKKTKQ